MTQLDHHVDDETELDYESFEAEHGEFCAECHEVGPSGKLFMYEGHSGAFCSRDCMRRYYGIKRTTPRLSP